MSINCCVIGTDTGVGKTHCLRLLCHGLRACGHQVWVHKPVACGGWDGTQTEDGRILSALADAAQDQALICPLQFPQAASPHLAAKASDHNTSIAAMSQCIRQLKGNHDLLVEGAGGLLAPLSSDLGTIVDLCREQALSCVLVTRPHLGTLNHTQLTMREARRQGITVLGMVINYHDQHIKRDNLAISTARTQLEQLCQLPVLAEIPYATTTNGALAQTLAQRLISAHAAVSDAGAQQ
jgi:dethiobiotin synthetase